MKKLRKIKLSNISKSQFDNEELVEIKGGYNPCYPCTGCVGAGSYTTKSINKYRG